jgi:putative signal transducing protein
MRDQPDDIVKLATASNPAQAHIWQEALRDEGIACEVVGDFLDLGFTGHPGQTAELWVHRDLLSRAREVLEQGGHSEETEEEETPN